MRHVAGLIRAAAHNAMTVLIYGETAPETVGRQGNHRSAAHGRFEHFNCGDVHEDTLASTLSDMSGVPSQGDDSQTRFVRDGRGRHAVPRRDQRMPMALQDKLMLVVENKRVRRMVRRRIGTSMSALSRPLTITCPIWLTTARYART